MVALTLAGPPSPHCHIVLGASSPGRRLSRPPPWGNQPLRRWRCLPPEAQKHTPRSAHHDTTSSLQPDTCNKGQRSHNSENKRFQFSLTVKPLPTCRWRPCQKLCRICHHWGRSRPAPHRCSDTADRPRSDIRGHKHTRPHPSSDSPYTWKTRCTPGICRDLPGHLSKETEEGSEARTSQVL